MPLGSFLLFDFGSSFGTISQGVHEFLPALKGSDIAVPKVHLLHYHFEALKSLATP
jgi:hypothetical protein